MTLSSWPSSGTKPLSNLERFVVRRRPEKLFFSPSKKNENNKSRLKAVLDCIVKEKFTMPCNKIPNFAALEKHIVSELLNGARNWKTSTTTRLS